MMVGLTTPVGIDWLVPWMEARGEEERRGGDRGDVFFCVSLFTTSLLVSEAGVRQH